VSVAENKALVQRYIEEDWNKGVVDLVDELYHPSFGGGSYGGIPGLKSAMTLYRRSFPDLHFTIEDLTAEDERIAYRWTSRGTHQGDYVGIAPTGKPITVTGITILHIVDGRITDDRTESNIHTLTEQLE